DDTEDGVIDENDVSDLVLVAGFSHDPERVCSRQGLSKLDVAAGAEALDVAVSAGNPYTLTGNTLDNAPILPGSVQLVFDGATTPKIAVDRRIGPGLGVIIDLSSPAIPRCYIDYATGALLDTFPNAPLGALLGTTAVTVDSTAGAGYSQRLELTDNINAATFITTTLQEGDMISVSGFSWRGLRLNGDGTVNRTGIDSDATAPIVFGTQAGRVDTVQELLDAVATLYEGSIQVATDSVESSLDDQGQICFRIMSNVNGTEPRYNTTADFNFSDSQGNTWPLFEDPHGRVTIYRGRAGGGFFSPNLSQEIINPSDGQPLFPAPFFPATRAEVPPLLPESPDANGKATAPGPGTIDDVYALADLTGGMVQFPFSVSTASGELPLFPDPTNPPANGSVGVGSAGAGTFIGGFRPRTATVGKIFSVIPNVPADPFPDIVVANGGDASLTAMIQVPKANLIPLNPALGLFFQIFDFLDGAFVTQNLDVAGLINSQLAAANQQSFFVKPSSFDFCRVRSADIDGDGFVDLYGHAGQFFLTARNLLGTLNPPAVPFDVRLAVVGLNPGFPQIGDINRDGRKDIMVPVQATAEIAALISVPPVTELLATGTGAPMTLNAQALTGFEAGRATPFPPSVTVTFESGGVPHLISREIPLSTTNFNLVLTRDPTNAQGMQADLGVVGGYNPLTFELTLSTGVNVDAALNANYDQFFTSNYTNNANLTNFKLIKFPTGFIPNDCIIADLNGDSLDDMVTVDTQPNSISVFFQVNESPLDNFINQPTGLGPLFISKADVISGNGVTEVMVSNSASTSVSIFVPDPILGLRLVQEVPLALPDPANPSQPLGQVPVPLLPFGGEGADLDGDGDDDYVVACSAVGGASSFNQFAPGMPGPFSGGWVMIPGMSQAELDAGGKFAPTTVGLGFGAPIDLTFADLNNDGLLDIVLGNNVSSFMSFYLNRGGQHPIFGGPNFGNLTTVPTLEPFLATPRGEPSQVGRIFVTRAGNPVQVSFTDLNNDGRRDVIFGAGDPREIPSGLASVGFMQGVDPTLNNNNNFGIENGIVADAFQVKYIAVDNVTPGGSVSIAAADFNNDGLQDIAFGDLTTNAAAGICLNTTDLINSPQNITFSVAPLAALGQPSALDVGDLNNDGFVDFVIPSQSDPVISIYLNDPNNPGSFGFPIIQRAPRGAVGLAILDVNNDGKLDVITVSRDTDSVNIFFQR
ncbi:MAG: VCBS repeat-containing protein, partial [Planctomycetota bacterium]|nr:VCBS repeat-containing protein [Planctomycetota bacterium]